MPDDSIPDLMTAREVAAAARLELATIHKRAQRARKHGDPRFPTPIRVGRLLRFRRDEVRRWLSGEATV